MKRKPSLKKRIFNVVCFIGTICFLSSAYFMCVMARHIEQIENRLVIAESNEAEYRTLLSMIFETDIGKAKREERYVQMSWYSAERGQTDSTPHLDSNNKPVMGPSFAMSRDLEYNNHLRLNQMTYVQGVGVIRVTGRMNERFDNKIDIVAGNRKAALMMGVQPAVKIISFR